MPGHSGSLVPVDEVCAGRKAGRKRDGGQRGEERRCEERGTEGHREVEKKVEQISVYWYLVPLVFQMTDCFHQAGVKRKNHETKINIKYFRPSNRVN